MDNTCSICFEDISLNCSFDIDNIDRLYITSCNHKYHYSCLYKWCFRKNSCPTCRTLNVINELELVDETTFLPLNLIDDYEIQTQINALLDAMFLYNTLQDRNNDYTPLITLLDHSRNIDLVTQNNNNDNDNNDNDNDNNVNFENLNTTQNTRIQTHRPRPHYNMFILRSRNITNNNIRNTQTRRIGMRFRF